MLVSFDVAALHFYILHKEELKIMSEYLKAQEDKTISTERLVEVAIITLK